MKGLGKRILVMAAVTAVCVWAAGKSSYAVKPYRLDEDTLAQQVQMLKENNLTMFSGVTIYDGIVIGDTAYYVMTQEGIEQECFLGEMTAKRSWLGTWKFYSMGSGDSGINYDITCCGGHNFLLLSGKEPEQQVAKVTLNWYGQTYEMTNESAKPYFQKMYDTVQSILSRSGNIEHPYLTSNGSKKKAVIVVTSNRGLAGGYNNNIVKLVAESGLPKESVEVYGIGKKGIESFERKGYYIASDDSEIINAPLFSDAVEIGRKVLDAYEAGEVGEIYLAYTSFKNTVVHTPEFIKLLPVEVKEEESADKKSEAPMNYEPEAEESLDLLIPKYINSIVYGAFIEAVASENGARMQAMDAATSNAEDMISTLSLAYNRARQGAITQELTEIISGAEALN